MYKRQQLDTCWVNVGGENPADFIRKYAGRIEIVHLKDFAGTKGGNMYALIGNDDSKKEAAAGSFEFRPLGSGLQDFPSILEASKEVGAHWVVVEPVSYTHLDVYKRQPFSFIPRTTQSRLSC